MSRLAGQCIVGEPIVHGMNPLTLVGGSDLSRTVLNICLSVAPSVVAADGGADACLSAGVTPLAVIGDMDSLSDRARESFADRLYPVTGQDDTDFEKCLSRIDAPLVLAAGFLGGRLDHTLSVLNVIWRRRAAQVVLVGEVDAVVLIDRQATLDIAPGARMALLPLAPVRVTTTGLRWDLQGQELSPVGLVSSSNEAAGSCVTITPEAPVFLSLPLAHLDAVTAVVRAR